jgi:PilZ domain
MSENRRSERRTTFRTGRIVPDDEACAVDCAILNLSDHGACVLVPVDAAIPDDFALFIDREEKVHHCVVAWRSGPRLGLSFDWSVPRRHTRPLAAAAPRRASA